MALASKSRSKAKAKTTKEAAPVQTQEEETFPPEEEAAETPAQEPEVETAEEASTKEVAVHKPAAAPATFGTQFQLALGEYKDQIPPVEFGTLPRLNASQGALVCEGESLGKTAVITMLSFNDSFAITPNENNADSSYCKFSYDNHVLNDGSGKTVADHLAYLRDEGFENAASKRYVEVVCMLDDADEDHDEIGNMVQVSLSPQSVKQFERYQLGCTVRLKQGKVSPEELGQVRLTAKTKTFGKNTFTLISFSQP